MQTAALSCFMTYLEGAGVYLSSHLADEQLDLHNVGKSISADWSTQNLWKRVHLLGETLGVNLAPYNGRHQWARDTTGDGTDYLKLIKVGGWKAGSRMVERYYGDKEIANEGVHLKR